MSRFLNYNYYQGCKTASAQLGMPRPRFEDMVEAQMAPEEVAQPEATGQGMQVPDAEAVVDFAGNDPTE